MNWNNWLDDLWLEYVKLTCVNAADKSIWIKPIVYNRPNDDDLGSFLYELYNNGASTKVAANAMINFEC